MFDAFDVNKNNSMDDFEFRVAMRGLGFGMTVLTLLALLVPKH
jgi:hypothetical protein